MANSKGVSKTYIICTSPRGNNASNYFFSFAKALILEGDKVVLILDKKKERNYKDISCPIYTWPSYRPTRLKDFVFFYKLCKAIKPDVVLGQFGSTNIVLSVGKLLGIKNRMVYWHTIFNANTYDSKQIAFKSKLYKIRKKYIIKYFSNLILTNSTATKNDLEREFKLQRRTILVIPFLIEDAFKDAVPLKSNRKNYISVVARLQRSKGHQQLIRFMPKVLNLYPNLVFNIIGDGPERKPLEKYIADLDLTRHVNFTGNISVENVYEYLKDSLVHISASLEEGFGLVNAEAIAAGTPIMAQKVGGIADILEDGYNGEFYDLNDEKSFINGFKTIMDNWQTYSNNARHTFLTKFDDNITNQKQRIQIIKPYLN